MTTPVLIAIAFLLGSVPTGLLIAKSRGIDPRTTGSGNIGATNILRTTGKGAAALTLAGDMLKGMIVVSVSIAAGKETTAVGLIGIAAVLGHDFSIFLRLKGGKGVATSFGVLAVYAPQTALLTGIIWLMTARMSRYSSLGALVSFGMLPLTIAVCDSREKLLAAVVLALLIFIKHRDNIKRLLKGQESKIGGSR